MADFCNQCATSSSFLESNAEDLAGLITKAQSDGGLSVSVICEGCGPTSVDWKGNCVSMTCPKGHGDFI